jgi:hypothetical protein
MRNMYSLFTTTEELFALQFHRVLFVTYIFTSRAKVYKSQLLQKKDGIS